MNSPVKLLFLEDDEVDRFEFARMVREKALPYVVTIATSLAQGRALLAAGQFDVVFADHRLPDGTAFDLFPSREAIGELIVILATGAGDEETAARALRAGMRGYLVKGVGHEYLRLLPREIETAIERRQLARQLRENEAKLRDLFDGTNDLIVSAAPDGRLNFVNRAWRDTLRYADGDPAGSNLFDLVPAPLREELRAQVQQAADGRAVSVATTLLARDGQPVQVEGRLEARAEKGSVVSLRIFFRDVTEQVSAEQRGRIAKTRLESVMALSTAVIYSCPAIPPFTATFVSESVEMLWGYRQAEFLQPGFWPERVHPADRERILQDFARIYHHGETEQEHTYRFRHASGEWRWVHDHVRVCAGDGQSQLEVIGVLTDITRQKEAELALRDAQARALRLQGTLLTLREYHEDDLGRFFRHVTEVATAALDVASTGIWFGQPDSELFACQDLFSAGGGHQGGAQLKVAQFPRLFAALDGQSSLACEDVRLDPWQDEIPGSALAGPEVTALLCAPLFFQDRILGLVIFLRDGAPRAWMDEEVKFAVAVAADIMLAVEHAKRLSAEAAAQDLRVHLERLVRERTSELEESELRFRQLAENINEVFYVVSAADRRFLYVSPAFGKVWGIEPATLQEHPGLWLDAVDPADRERVREALNRSLLSPVEIEYRILQPNGSTRWINDRSFPVRNAKGEVYRRTGLASDITDRRESELEAMRRQRIETIGTIASGVAHDLNNALAPITLGIHLLRKKHPGEDRIISSMQSSAMHGANMIRQLLTFAKGVEGQRIGIEPAALFREVAVLIEGSFPKNIVLRTHCPEDVWPMRGDPTQLHQVLLNLCVNARDAMPNGGLLELEAANQLVDAAYAAGVPDARPGSYVTLRVRDSGQGIPEAIIERIFDPFFTTKGPEKGTGLGLSTVMGIVRSHGGFIRVYSWPGSGAAFVIHVPVAERTSAAPHLPPDREKPLRGNGETILIVDDEPSVREVTAGALADLNFRVIPACDGTDALVRAAENRAVLRGVITDLHMPHMDGIKVVQTLRHMLPGIPIMVASGRIDEREARELAALGVVAQLHKPFTEATLVAALRKLMEAPAAAPSPTAAVSARVG